ncbi:unnamed protein product [Fraxinus pennsylvanica]|uniref:Scarecrow-like protein 23 n=1 Tax=Fraxinus pennsylvanica TaxID=56036 RepID=A0AAD2AE45_9LAMI|nr:unnamed protein product [Fraxinus pennsylvanica]
MLHSSNLLAPLLPHNNKRNNSSSSSTMNSGKRATVDLTSEADDSVKRHRSHLPATVDLSVSGEKEHEYEEEQLGSAIIEQEDSTGLRLLGLLLQCAECVAMDNLDDAGQLLPEIAELSSPFGSSAQRVGAYFADALSSRIISSYLANQAIQQALDGVDHVHVIDLDIMQGLQWPGLFHILASRSRKIKSIRITGLGQSMDLLNSTGQRLAEFASALNIPFQFQPLEGKIGNVKDLNQLGIKLGETVVVHWMHHCLYDITGSDVVTLRLLSLLRPKLITIVEQDLSHGGSFLGRFVEALHYYSALFDALGDGLAADSVERHTVEQQLFGYEIRNIVAVGGPKRTGEVKVERWGDELTRVGFRPVSLAGNPAAQASLLLGMFPWQGYTLVEESGWLKLGWKDLSLLTASAWQFSD